MKKKHVYAAVGVAIAAVLCSLLVFVCGKSLDANAGTIRFPFYQGTATMDAARDMIFSLGWEHKSEGGDAKHVAFEAADKNGKTVTFDFMFGGGVAEVQISTENDSQYSVEEITKDLAKRLGMRVDGDPLPTSQDNVSSNA